MQPMRPRFSELLPFSRDEAIQRLEARQVCQGCPCKLTVLERHVTVDIRDDLRHMWSPQLSLQLDERSDGQPGSELHGLFGPSPAIWTSFLAAYASVSIVMFFGGILGLAQQVAKQAPWGYLSLPLGALLLAGIYGASLVGQRLAAEQMEQLACFLRAALNVKRSPTPLPTCDPHLAEAVS